MVYTSFVLLAAGLAAGADLAGPSWHTDYHRARQVSASQRRPMAVILGSGPAGWKDLNLDDNARSLLADHYVPVFIDTSTPAGMELSAAFEIRSGRGIVLSDHGGERQAFWHDGHLGGFDLVQNLQNVAIRQVASTTETLRRPSTTSFQPAAYQFTQPFFGGFGAAGCST